MYRLYPFFTLFLLAAVACFAWFHLRRWLEALFPRRESFLNDPAPASVIWQNRHGLNGGEARRDAHRGFLDKTETRVWIYQFSLWSVQLVFIWFPVGIFLTAGAVLGLVILMKLVLG